MSEALDAEEASLARARRSLALLVDANRSILGELSLEEVLRRIVTAARDLVGARYVALGVTGANGLLEELVHEGMDEALAGRTAASPAGSGLLRVPISGRRSVHGYLYVSDRADGTRLTQDDLRVVGAFGASAGVAIENARLYESSTRRQRWAEVTSEVTAALLEPRREVDPVGLVLEALHTMTRADAAAVVVPTTDPDNFLVTHAFGAAAGLQGGDYPRPRTVPDHVLRLGRGLLISTVQERTAYEGPMRDSAEIGPAMALPMVADGRTYGVLMTARRPGGRPFDDDDLALGESFAAQASVAMALADARAHQERLVLARDASGSPETSTTT